MKKLKRQPILLWTIILLQSIFILSSFTTNKEKENDLQSYRIEKKYNNGSYFYVLISSGEAKAFIKE